MKTNNPKIEYIRFETSDNAKNIPTGTKRKIS